MFLLALMVRLLTVHLTLHALPSHAYHSIQYMYFYFCGIYLKFPFPSATVKKLTNKILKFTSDNP